MRSISLRLVLFFGCALFFICAHAIETPDEIQVVADQLVADRMTGAFAATGHVRAVARPLTILTESVRRDASGSYLFADPTAVTTCSNAVEHLHWKLEGEVAYRTHEAVVIRNAWLSFYGYPVCWLPFWYYPLETNYGFHFMPGYNSRWGTYLMTEYVYGLYRSEDGRTALSGRTRLDLREENGVAAGQDLSWCLGDLGAGDFHVYYAWDEDADRYQRHATSRKWHYANWTSPVPDERYRLEFLHRCELTERDSVWADLNYMSDSSFNSDFLRKGFLMLDSRFRETDVSHVGWEHLEGWWSSGLIASAPLSEFQGGVCRLPEFVLSVNPIRVPGLFVNYESQTRVGYYKREEREVGTSQTALPFRYSPGLWADYDAFRMDTYHRLALPLKFADVLSVVPRFGYHGTFWDDAGNQILDGRAKAGSTGENVYRSIFEGGVTFAARGVGTFDNGWSHLVEPYLDVLAQEADYSGLRDGHRPYFFDGIDGSYEWLDQFAGRSRNLPYSYVGITPGLRNALRCPDEQGNSQTFLDFDFYCAVQFTDTDYTDGDRYHRLVKNPEDPNYGASHPLFFPGARVMWTPRDDWMLSARAEYDAEKNTVAYARLFLSQQVNTHFSWMASYVQRDHRRWDYSSAVFDPTVLRDESFNWARYEEVELSFQYELCDEIVWGPYLCWDCRESELSEIGTWIDYRTDCLGFRLIVSHECKYDRVDYSYHASDTSVEFMIYLRAFGADFGSPTKL